MTREEYDDRNYRFEDIPEDPRFKTCKKEALTVIGFWSLFVALTLIIMYTIGVKDPTEYTYVCGLPLWFFLVCLLILGCIGIPGFFTGRRAVMAAKE